MHAQHYKKFKNATNKLALLTVPWVNGANGENVLRNVEEDTLPAIVELLFNPEELANHVYLPLILNDAILTHALLIVKYQIGHHGLNAQQLVEAVSNTELVK